MEVGFIGLGAMGLPMARHLVEAGHRVTVASRSPGPVGRAADFGALDGGSPRGVAEAAEVVVLCVPNSPQVEEVVDAMLPALSSGTTVVDCSTIDPEVARAQHERVRATGAGFLDAPISGGTAGAEAGTLTVMVGGEAPTLERARPALDAFAARIVHVGGPGMGQVTKLCNNLVYAAQMLATAEATALGGQVGRRPRQAPRGPGPLDGRLRRGADAAAGGGGRRGQPRLERLASGIHDRADGEGPRPRARLRRGGRGAVAVDGGVSPGPHRCRRRRFRPRGLLVRREGRVRARRPHVTAGGGTAGADRSVRRRWSSPPTIAGVAWSPSSATRTT